MPKSSSLGAIRSKQDALCLAASRTPDQSSRVSDLRWDDKHGTGERRTLSGRSVRCRTLASTVKVRHGVLNLRRQTKRLANRPSPVFWIFELTCAPWRPFLSPGGLHYLRSVAFISWHAQTPVSSMQASLTESAGFGVGARSTWRRGMEATKGCSTSRASDSRVSVLEVASSSVNIEAVAKMETRWE